MHAYTAPKSTSESRAH